MRPSAKRQMKAVILMQCAAYWCLLVSSVDSSRVGGYKTEAEKQSAFEQLLGKAGRLRMAHQTFEPQTTLPPTTMSTMPIMLSDEEAKRHDRRHAVAVPEKKQNKNKKDHPKRQHHAGYFHLYPIFSFSKANLVLYILLLTQFPPVFYKRKRSLTIFDNWN